MQKVQNVSTFSDFLLNTLLLSVGKYKKYVCQIAVKLIFKDITWSTLKNFSGSLTPSNMNIYKDFIYNVRKMECETPHLIVIEEHPPIFFYGCVKSLIAIPFLESCYNLYYGEVRKIIRSFLRYYCITGCHAVKAAEDFKNTLNYNSMMRLFDKTVVYHQRSHDEFIKEFQPIESAIEHEKFDEIVSQYNTFMENLMELGARLKVLNKQDKIDIFAKDHFTICVEKLYQLNEYVHVFIARWLESHVST